MKVSVVIPAYNEVRYLGRCLDHLAAQTLPASQFEVVVVDNGSTDDTASLARSYAGRIEIRVLSLLHKTAPAVARNAGAASSTGDVLAFLDADCLVTPDWLAQALALGPADGLWGAHYRIPDDATWVGSVWARYQACEMSGAVSFLPACTLFLRRRDFDRIGGFPDVETSEDVEFSARVRAAGMPVLAFPRLAVVHLGTPRTLGHFYRQTRWHGRDVLPLFLRNLPSTANLGIVGLSVYTLIVFWLLVIALVVGPLLLDWHVPLVLAVLLLAPPVLLTLRKAVALRSARSLPALCALYTVYLLARAAAITRMFSARSLPGHRRTA